MTYTAPTGTTITYALNGREKNVTIDRENLLCGIEEVRAEFARLYPLARFVGYVRH